MELTHPALESYDLLLLFTGAALLVTTVAAGWLKRFNLSSTFLYLAVGLAAGPLLLDLAPADPLEAIPVLERVAELAVIMSLIVIGIRIGRPLSWRYWRSTARLILIVMPATILAVALTGYWLLGLALGPAILLGAILAPTDPILAGPLEEHSLRDESEERFGLSSEAGFNDGFAFPFVYLGLYATVQLAEWESWIGYWLLKDLVYAIVVALPIGWFLGLLCGKTYLKRITTNGVSNKRREFIPLALLLAVYGLVEAIGAYGFLAAFTVGLGFRRALETDHEELTQFAGFTEAVDDLVKAGVLIMVGALLRWELFAAMGWELLLFGLILIFVLRPGLTLLATARSGFDRVHRLYWAWFGIRGIGSIYYMAYALRQGLDEPVAQTLFTITIGTILISFVLHGFSVPPFLRHFDRAEDVEL